MKALDWTWRDREAVPTLEELKEYAHDMLSSMVEEGGSYRRCGGFEAVQDEGVLDLRFIVESWDCYDMLAGEEEELKKDNRCK